MSCPLPPHKLSVPLYTSVTQCLCRHRILCRATTVRLHFDLFVTLYLHARLYLIERFYRLLSLFSFIIMTCPTSSFFFFFNDTATTEIYTLSLHDALPILQRQPISRSLTLRSWKP